MKTWREKLSEVLTRISQMYPYQGNKNVAFEIVEGIFLTPSLVAVESGFSCPNLIKWQLCVIDAGLDPAAVNDKFISDLFTLIKGQL